MNIQININKNASGYVANTADTPVLSDSTTNGKAVDAPLAENTLENTTGKNVQNKVFDCSKLTSCHTSAENKLAVEPKENKFSFERGMVDMFSSFMSSFKEMMQSYLGQIKDMVSSIIDAIKGLIPKPVTPQPVNPPASNPVNNLPETPRKMESFPDRMPKILSGHAGIGHVNEVDLQAGVIAYQLYQKSEDAEKFFLSKLTEERGKMGPAEALKSALIATQEAGKISKNEAEFLFTLSHRASQLDENHAEVSKSENGAGTMDLGNAIKTAEITLASVIHGKIILEPRPLY